MGAAGNDSGLDLDTATAGLGLAEQQRGALRGLARPTRGLRAAGYELRPAAIAALLGIVVLTGVTAAIGLSSPIVDRPLLFVSLRTFYSLSLAFLALVAVARRSSRRLSGLLIALAYSMVLTGLTAADGQLLFALGRLAVPVSLLLTIYICLAYPRGWIEDGVEARAFRIVAVLVVTLDLANVLLSHVPPVAGPYVRCAGTSCPPNPLNIVSLAAGPSHAMSIALGLAMTTAVFAAAVLIARRASRANKLQRRSLAPLFAWTFVTGLGYGAFIAARALDADAKFLNPAGIVLAVIIATMPIAIAAGLVRGRWFAMGALEQLIGELGDRSSAGLQRTMSLAFNDPSLQLLFWLPSARRYVDVDGEVVELSTIESGRNVTQFTRDHDKVAAAVHDPMLSIDGDVLETAGKALSLALDNARLEADLSGSRTELEASRKRIAWAADEERRRIERDLHDGAQQDLVALRLKLNLLEELTADDSSWVAHGIADAGRHIDVALERIRDLAKGIYPSVLRDLGLSHALASIARELPLQISLRGQLRRRFAPEVETAVYFCCVEALQNVTKHCGGGTRVTLTLAERSTGLEFIVADTGPGFDQELFAASRGLAGMRDRLESIGGQVRIDSRPGSGTTITGLIRDAAPSAIG